jgi:hypothetical protein
MSRSAFTYLVAPCALNLQVSFLKDFRNLRTYMRYYYLMHLMEKSSLGTKIRVQKVKSWCSRLLKQSLQLTTFKYPTLEYLPSSRYTKFMYPTLELVEA